MAELFDDADAELFDRMIAKGWKPVGSHNAGRYGDWRDPEGWSMSSDKAIARFKLEELQQEGWS